MTTRGRLDLKGLEKYLEDLAQADQNVDQAAAKALVAGGDVLADGMRDEIDRQNIYETGDLRDHIHRTEPVKVGNTTLVDVGVFDGENLPDAALARKANANEYGYTRGGKHYPPRSYIRSGTDKRRRAAFKAMEESLKADGKL